MNKTEMLEMLTTQKAKRERELRTMKMLMRTKKSITEIETLREFQKKATEKIAELDSQIKQLQ